MTEIRGADILMSPDLQSVKIETVPKGSTDETAAV